MGKRLIGWICCCLLLAGCWDQRELNELAIVVAFGIDKAEEGYRVSAQVVVPSEVSFQTSAGRSPVTIYEAEGETVFEAIRKMTKESPRRIYPGHLQILVIGEGLAREGIRDTLDLMNRDWEIRSDYSVVISKDRLASDILSVSTTITNIPAGKLFETLETSHKSWSSTHVKKLHDVITDITSDGKDPVLTGVQMTGDPESGSDKGNVDQILPASRLFYDNLAVFQADRLVGWLNGTESEAYNFTVGSIKNTVKVISCPKGGQTTIEVTKAESKIEASFPDGEPAINIRVDAQGNVGSVECDVDLIDLKTLPELEKIFAKKLAGDIEETVASIQSRYDADIFGFGEVIHRADPAKWNRMKGEWKEVGFPETPVTVDVKMKIEWTGTVLNSSLQ
ncbi:Ger(x)C family spore germination protein [Bhargavaea cecembensis]|uniref:Ger(x)C family spore germination protein n=1 Tax=Bhargavaea cecembensis TaxID=394098 RepID=UPI00058AD9FD|nr:Ger(x)C family spore germination protein [Bhargavaea cecembensis]